MMSIDTTVMHLLIVVMKMSHKGLAFKDAIVTQIAIDEDAMVQGKSFKGLLSSDSFRTRETHLLLHMNVPTHVVNKYTSTNIGVL